MKSKKMIIFGIILITLIMVSFSNITANNLTDSNIYSSQRKEEYVKGQVIVRFKDSKNVPRYSSILGQYKSTTVLKQSQTSNSVLMQVEEGKEQEFIDEISSNPNVEYATLNRYMYACEVTPNDPYYNQQWAPKAINCGVGWQNFGFGEKHDKLAILDTGIDYTHEDLKKNYVSGGRDWCNNDSDPLDDNGHGTFSAGIAAAAIDNEKGIAGVGNIGIMAEKVLNFLGIGFSFDIYEGIKHAADSGADVILLNFANFPFDIYIQEACDYAWEKGAVLVAPAGNLGIGWINYPAAYESVIAVGAVDTELQLADFSNFGYDLELVAPGEQIITTSGFGDYEYISGTSAAAAYVAGVATYINTRGYYKNTEIRNILRNKAIDLGEDGRDVFYGYGLVDASFTGKTIDELYKLSILIHKIKGLDPIDIWPDEDPEWYYRLIIKTSDYEIKHYNYNLESIEKEVGESVYWEHDWISENSWDSGEFHLFYVNEPIVDVDITLFDNDIMFDDKADISSDDERHTLHFRYDIVNNVFFESESDEILVLDGWFVSDGELDGNSGDEDDAKIWFMISPFIEDAPVITHVNIEGNKKVGSEVSFKANVMSGNKPFRWFWDFGDGFVSSDAEPVHSYYEPGSYVIKVKVMDSQDLVSNEFKTNIEILGAENPFIDDFTGDTKVKEDEEGEYQITGIDPSGQQLKYAFDWNGDDVIDEWSEYYNSEEICTMKHKWEDEGSYTIKVKAINKLDLESDYVTLTVNVEDKARIYFPNILELLNRILERFFIWK
jgi:hypothetical protein